MANDTKSKLPVVEVKPIAEKLSPVAPTDEKYTDGIFLKRSDGEKYALCIHEEDNYGRTHSLKNTAHFWQGTKEQFQEHFEKP